MRRIISATNGGLVFRDNDPADFARNLHELVSTERRVQLGENGRKAVIEEYNWKQDGRRLIQTVDSLFPGAGD
jgi:glycosyltransferase involved in cell wall biosynthesis